MRPPPPRSTLFPYTTLFRSRVRERRHEWERQARSGRGLALPRDGHGEIGRAHSELQSRSELVCRLLHEKKNMDVIARFVLLRPLVQAVVGFLSRTAGVCVIG